MCVCERERERDRGRQRERERERERERRDRSIEGKKRREIEEEQGREINRQHTVLLYLFLYSSNVFPICCTSQVVPLTYNIAGDTISGISANGPSTLSGPENEVRRRSRHCLTLK